MMTMLQFVMSVNMLLYMFAPALHVFAPAFRKFTFGNKVKVGHTTRRICA